MDDQEVQRTLGDAIRTRRQGLGWSQEDLAKRIADHGDEAFRQSDVSRLERGKVTLPRRERLEHVAAVLGFPGRFAGALWMDGGGFRLRDCSLAKPRWARDSTRSFTDRRWLVGVTVPSS